MAKKIFVGNYKGGVGKTTCSYSIGAILREEKNKVLLIDLDPQSSLSEICMSKLGDEAFIELKENETLNYVFSIKSQASKLGIENIKIDSKTLIKDNGVVDFIPSSLLYKNGGLDILSVKLEKDIRSILIIKQFIQSNNLDEEYDYIIFDCPPSNNIITQSAYMTADYYIIPTIMDAISTKGVKHYKRTIEDSYDAYISKNVDSEEIIKLFLGDKPKAIGVFEARRKNNVNTDKYRQLVESSGNYLFKAVISDYKEITDSMGSGTIAHKDMYKKLVDEIIDRINVI